MEHGRYSQDSQGDAREISGREVLGVFVDIRMLLKDILIELRKQNEFKPVESARAPRPWENKRR